MINKDWESIILASEYNNLLKDILKRIEKDLQKKEVYPSKENIFRALNLASFENVKVVIIGQDPYHGVGEANGLAFSLNDGIKITPSLKNIFKELKSDLGIDRSNMDLSGWAKQGVLLLNAILTVEKDKPLSHKGFGWESITDYIIKYISDNKNNVVFILWGNYAKEKSKLIDAKKHYIIESNHPSPLSASRGFFGSKPFSKCNDYLKKNNQSIIDWSL